MSFVDYTANDIACEAYVARPAGAGPHPTVLIAPTVRGPTQLEHDKADALAAEGYRAIVLDHYGKSERDLGDRAMALMNGLLSDRALLRERLLAHLAFAQGLDGVDRDRIAIVGYCFGGLCALDLARTGTDAIRGAVAIHGVFSQPELGPQPPIKAKVLVLHGWDDPIALPDAVLGLTRELTEAGADWQLHAYGHTVHGFTNPEAAVAGRVMYNADADRRANAALSYFLMEVLA
ncbi:putative dienelactone hydrolase [Sphingomonas changbaiensis NBRC 104936]|uniref:Putative dienelactone hydrolase n=1 Tax=Sphingomonas changbaiensis NBRC 104936 TaxID=1219043 RepID=A0A0E9ML90_9SPHN|nr:dienelactone hydrolase family protein [Sphingomonas changbaiensis]GAO38186.1 putative dienelactone hydrolase [Sphingomonas changbaiensis NBRC 104936]